jgi:hypothetical protein
VRVGFRRYFTKKDVGLHGPDKNSSTIVPKQEPLCWIVIVLANDIAFTVTRPILPLSPRISEPSSLDRCRFKDGGALRAIEKVRAHVWRCHNTAKLGCCLDQLPMRNPMTFVANLGVQISHLLAIRERRGSRCGTLAATALPDRVTLMEL